MHGLIIFALITLVFITIYQIAKAAETASVLKGNERQQEINTNKLMAWLLLIMFLLGMYGVYKCHISLIDRMLPIPASDHGQKYETMFNWTIVLTGIVFFLTQAALFFFIFKFKDTGTRKAEFISHNNTLEVIWTTVPAITLLILVVIGLRNWITMTGPAPDGHIIVEVTGKQFNWIIRYPGPDKTFGQTDFRKIDDANNILGIDWNDPAAKDDIIIQNGEMHLLVDKPVKLVIKSRDVIHNVGLPHFRMKMDAVPGVVTSMWFTPLITSKQMAKEVGNPEFVYEINCAEMCGKGHYSMRGTVIVETENEFNEWLKGQPSYYSQVNGSTEEVKPTVEEAPVVDSQTVAGR